MGNLFNHHNMKSGENYDFSLLTPYLNFPSNSTDWETDAAFPIMQMLKVHTITQKQILEINVILDTHERISLVYLLAKDYETALAVMLKSLKYEYEFKHFLRELIKSKTGSNEIIEALCVIQNYEVLKMLGYERSQLEKNFSPMIYHTHVYISKTRKLLYRIMEKLTMEEKVNLIQLFKTDTHCINFPQYKYLEMYFAYLFKMDYANDNNLSNVVNQFKFLKLDHYADLLIANNIPKKRPPTSTTLNCISAERTTLVDSENLQPNVVIEMKHLDMDNRKELIDIYPMDENFPGVVLIIENIDFYEEFDDKYKDDVIISDTALEKRIGSHCDSKRLKGLFKSFGYNIIHKINQTHIQMLNIIEDVSHNHITQEHSSFILIMLSHGLKNQIIGCNSIPVNIDDIKKKINSKVLEGKPKILIIQACQGNEIMREYNPCGTLSADVTIDGLKQNEISSYPWQRHILELWSTVPGYVSFRTWMIQALCDILESSYRLQSFTDICTRVNYEIGKRRVEYEPNENNVMVSNYHSTLYYKFFLPPMRTVNEDDESNL